MLSTDRISFFLGVGAVVVTFGVGTCSTNGRFDGLNRRIDDLNADVNQRFDDVDRRFDGVDRRFDEMGADVNRRFDEMGAGVNRRFDEMGADIRGLRVDVNGLDDRLRAVEVAFGRVDQRLLTIERVVLPPGSPGG